MRCSTALLFSLTLPLAAQVDTAPAVKSVAPPAAFGPPLFTLEMRGPATMANQLRPTNLGSLLASEKGEKLWRGAVDNITAEWKKAHGDDASFPAARDRVLGYAGRIRGLGVLDPQVERRRTEPGAVALLFEPDGKTDLAALGKDFGRWIGRGRQMPAKDAKIGDVTLQAMGDEFGQFAVGVLGDGRLALCGGENQELLAAALSAARAHFTDEQKAKPSDPLFALRIDMQQALAGQMRSDREMRHLGFESLRQFEITLQPRGPRVQYELNLGFAGERGIFAAFFPEHDGIPALFGWAPQTALATKIGRFDLKPLWTAAMKMIGEMNEDGAAAAEAKAKEALGIDVPKDLLPHVTDELLVCWNPKPHKPDEEPSRDVPVIAAMRLKDGKAFSSAVATMFDKVGLDTSDVDGVLRTDRNFLSDWVNFAVRGEQFVIAINDPGSLALDAFLAQQPQASQLPDEVKELGKAMPPGCNGFGLVDVHVALRDHVGLLFEVLDDTVLGLPITFDDPVSKELLGALAPLLAEHNLGRVVTLSGTKDNRWVFRLLW